MLRVFNPQVSNTHRQAIRQRTQRLRGQSGGTNDSGAARRLTMEDFQDRRQTVDETALVDRLAAKLADRLGVNSVSDARTNNPGIRTGEPVTLKQVFESCFERNRHDCTDSSWSGYRTLLAKWTRFWCGRGPDLRTLTAEHLQDFFEGVDEWKTERSWTKNADLLFALLKSACPLTVENKRGMKANAWLQIEQLPVWSPPRDRWFRDRQKAKPDETDDGRGGHKRCSLPLLTVAEFGKLLTACKSATFLDPLWWECWFCQLWFHGPRWADFWRYTWNSHDAEGSLKIDLKSATIHVTETKAGGNGTCPIPSWLLGRLSLLKSKQNASDGELVYVGNDSKFRITTGDALNRERRWRTQFVAIWQSAGIPLRNPHQMRGVAISYWIKHAPIYRFAAIGHAPPKGDTQLRNYATFDADFQKAAETFPFPDEHRLR